VSDALRRHACEHPDGRGAVGSIEPLSGVLGEIAALEVQRLHLGQPPACADRVVEADLLAFRTTVRPVLRVPGCPECAAGWSATAPAPHGGTPAEPARLLDLWDRLVDEKVGVVQSVAPLPVEEDEPDFVHYLSTACNTDRLTRLRNFGNNGGVATDHPGAVAKALGEAVERYCSAFFRYADLLVSSYRDLPGPGTPPEAFALYRPEQYAAGGFPWRPFTDDAPVSWTLARSLRTGESRYVPAAMVFVPFHYSREGRDTPITQPISTGLAAGSSFEDAALSGLCEAVERDAFTLTWQARLARPHLPVGSLPPDCRDRVRRFTDAGLRVEIMDITTDLGVPTVLTFALGDRPTSPALAVAAATSPVPELAVRKSLEELAHTRKFSRQVMDYLPPLPVDVAGGHPAVEEQKHHLRFYCPQPAKSFAAFAWASEAERPFGELAAVPGRSAGEQLAALVDRLAAADLDVLACDLTTPDVADLGLSVVRIVVPGLHPLFMGHRNRALGGHRLYTVPQRLGLPGPAPGDADNPYPHPFP
jgi:ribosomal protein S12 methylthiotransferase accessory factor